MRCSLALVGILVGLASRGVPAASFVPPIEASQPQQPLALVAAELSQNKSEEAARRVVSLQRAGGGPLFQADWGLVSLGAWLETLTPTQRQALASGMERVVGASAERARVPLTTGTASVEALLGLAEQFPLTTAATQCILDAARRLASLGDVDGAIDVYERARRAGAWLAAEEVALVERLTVARATRRSKEGFAGTPPFEANWFTRRQPYESPRVWPVVRGSSVIVAGATRVVGGSTRGLVEWVWSVETLLQEVNGKLPDKSVVEELARRHPKAAFEPAIFVDLEGRPRIVVARQPSIRNPGFLALRAVSATDGRLLWATDRSDRFDSHSFVSLPAVVGRYTYAAARKRQRGLPEQLVLVAIETGSGAMLWESTLGELADQPSPTLQKREWLSDWNDLFAEMTAPAVEGDCVYLNPGGSSLVSVDRFTGTIRWVHVYEDAPADLPRNDRLKSARREAARRFRTTPLVSGEFVLVAPRDSIGLLAVHRTDGRGAWTCTVSPSGTLVGEAGGVAVLASVDSLHGVRVADGTVAWTNPVSGARRPTGPGVVFDGVYWAALPQGVIGFSVESGDSRSTVDKRVPVFRNLLSAAPLRAALIPGGILDAFLRPSGERGDGQD